MRLLPLLLCLLFCARTAQAGDIQCVEKEPSTLESLDGLFGKWFVGPLATVMFADLVFWDNTLAPGEMPPIKGHGPHAGAAMVGNQEVIAVQEDPQAGYVVRTREAVEVSALPFDVQVNGQQATISGSMSSEDIQEAGGCSVPYTGDLSTDFGMLTLQAAVDADVYQLNGLAPFPVIARQSGDTWQVLPTLVPIHDHQQGALIFRTTSDETAAAPLANPGQINLPLVVAWLVFGAIFFTLRMRFINLRGFKHAIDVTAGKYDKHDDPGEVSHFQALASALSATVGLGNIAGVAIAVSVGGPGAIFWMIMAGFLGMSSKFTECTLGQMYRSVDKKGAVLGGPMRYLDQGLSEQGQAGLGKVLAILFAVMCIGGSFGGGNMFQANQSYAAVGEIVPLLTYGDGLLYGIFLAAAVGLVILGGIKRIGMAAGIIVPVMCGVYVLAAIYILLVHAADIPAAFGTIVGEAFAPTAVEGGIIGVLVQGFRRAAFSNEAGVGSASIAHSAASTDEPVREGVVALLEPFIDTIIVCTMTGLVVVITGAYQQNTGDGVLMTSAAFSSVIEWFPLVLSFAVVSFAFSTMISWSYYGERCATYLLGERASLPYKIIFLLFVVFGSVFKLGNVLDFSDLMILGMAFPNILGMLLLSNKVRAALDTYWGKYTSGEMKPVNG